MGAHIEGDKTLVGKLFLDLGDSYAFDIRRARAVAEAAQAGGGGGGGNTAEPLVDGPNASEHGQPYWIQRDESGAYFIWFDVDADPDPDIRQSLNTFLSNPAVFQLYRDDVRTRAEALGYSG